MSNLDQRIRLTPGLMLGVLALTAIMFAGIEPGLLITLPAVLWCCFRRRLNPVYLSPVSISTGIFYLIGVFGYLLRNLLYTARGSGASISIALGEDEALETLRLIMLFTSIVIVVSGMTAAGGANSNMSMRGISWSVVHPPAFVIWLTGIPFVVMLFDTGIGNVLQRNYYLVGEGGTILGGIGGPLVTATVLVVGYIYGSSRGPSRVIAIIIFSAYLGLLFSFGSRRFALSPLLFSLGVFLASNNRKTRMGVLLGAVVSVVLLPLPLVFRELPMHGLLPYLSAVGNLDLFAANWLGALNNVLVSFGIIALTAFSGQRFSWSDLGMAANPFPGEAIGWYTEVPRFLLNPYTPVAGIGELGNVGWLAVVIFGCGIGVVLGWIELAVRRRILVGSYVYSALLIGMSFLFSLQMVQYTLRSAMRLLLYQIVIELGLRVIWSFRMRKHNKLLVREISSGEQPRWAAGEGSRLSLVSDSAFPTRKYLREEHMEYPGVVDEHG